MLPLWSTYVTRGIAEGPCAVTVSPSVADSAKPALRWFGNAEPYCLLAIFKKRDDIGPGGLWYWVSFPSFQLARPFKVPIHRVPSCETSKGATKLLGSRSVPGGCHGRARTPSKRSSPNSVPSQRYPSGV